MATELRPARITDEMLWRIRSEYLEMPGLDLTLKQAQRLWALDEATCRGAMQLLVDARFLCEVVSDVRELPPDREITFRRRQLVAVPFDRKAA